MFDALQRVVTSDAFVQIVLAVVAAVWALPRVSSWRRSVEASKWAKLFDFAENAVVQTWNGYTSALKAKAADGKLTADVAKIARKTAVSRLRDLAASDLPGLLEKYGQEGLEALVGQVHAKLQKEGAVG